MTTLRELVENAMSDLGDYIEDNPNEPEHNYHDTITEIADSAVPVYNHDLLEAAREDVWLATTEPELIDTDITAVRCIALNIYEHVSSELSNALDDLRDELTPECEDCGKRFKADDMHLMEDDAFVCSDCSGDHIEPDA